jgi:hypothetical protein
MVFKCTVCKDKFSSRNKLHQHLNSSGHVSNAAMRTGLLAECVLLCARRRKTFLVPFRVWLVWSLWSLSVLMRHTLLNGMDCAQVSGAVAAAVESKGAFSSGKEQRPVFLNEFSSLLHGSDKFSDCVFIVGKGTCSHISAAWSPSALPALTDSLHRGQALPWPSADPVHLVADL